MFRLVNDHETMDVWGHDCQLISGIAFMVSFTLERVASMLNPAALGWPPPPNLAAMLATSMEPSERILTWYFFSFSRR